MVDFWDVISGNTYYPFSLSARQVSVCHFYGRFRGPFASQKVWSWGHAFGSANMHPGVINSGWNRKLVTIKQFKILNG